jgi:hypothetical protein
MTVVDADGNPVVSPPRIYSPTGGVPFYATYAGVKESGESVQLQYYKPPSNIPKSETSS